MVAIGHLAAIGAAPAIQRGARVQPLIRAAAISRLTEPFDPDQQIHENQPGGP